jgi:hypothetical protein
MHNGRLYIRAREKHRRLECHFDLRMAVELGANGQYAHIVGFGHEPFGNLFLYHDGHGLGAMG